jgi:hypothetical protein
MFFENLNVQVLKGRRGLKALFKPGTVEGAIERFVVGEVRNENRVGVR